MIEDFEKEEQSHIQSAKEVVDQDGEFMGEFVGDFGI